MGKRCLFVFYVLHHNLMVALLRCRVLLIHYGGHPLLLCEIKLIGDVLVPGLVPGKEVLSPLLVVVPLIIRGVVLHQLLD